VGFNFNKINQQLNNILPNNNFKIDEFFQFDVLGMKKGTEAGKNFYFPKKILYI
jgi:hypothetical protein